MKRYVKKIIATFAAVLCLFGCTVPAFATTYRYDALGRVIEVIYDSGQTVYYTYDAAGNIVSVTTSNPSTGGGTGGSENMGDGGSSYPEQITVTSPDADGSYTAKIPDYVKTLAASDNFRLTLGSVMISLPVSELQSAMSAGDVKISVSPANKTVLSQAASTAGRAEILSGFSININAESNLTVSANITVALPAQDVSRIQKSGTPQIYYYNPAVKSFIDAKAVFNLSNATAAFTTNSAVFLKLAADSSSAFVVLAKSYRSDTGSSLNVEPNKTYQFKVTSSAKPTFVCGNSSVFKVTSSGSKGNDYFFKVTAVGALGSSAGFYVNGEKIPSTVGTISAPPVKSDTGKTLNVKAGKTYQFKLTSSVKPLFVCGNSSVFKVTASGSKGNDYFFKVTAVGKPGSSAGFYINGEKAPHTVGTIV